MSPGILWRAAEAAAATGGRNTAKWTAGGVSIDSRELNRGDLFVAIQGPNFDGHDFIAEAFAKGAAAAVTHRPADGPAGGPLLVVEDTLRALRHLGRAARARAAARITGVTGSVGKTGTKEALAHCLRAQAPTASSGGSLNNHWGLPLSLARMGRDAQYGVFELGMNHAGEIRELADILKPDVALITNVEAAHLGYFELVAEIADAKAEIFEAMTPGAVAVLNRDSPHFDRLTARARAAGCRNIVSFGQHAHAEARAIDVALEPTHSHIVAEVRGQRIDYTVALPGAHWVANSLAVLAAVAALGADVAAAAASLARLAPLKGRGARHAVHLAGGDFTLFDDSYNANPASMRAAFDVLCRAETGPGGRRIAVLGDMLELGPASGDLHRALAPALDAAGVDLVFTCGPAMAALHDALPSAVRGGHAVNSQDLVPRITGAMAPGDAVLVKGSLGSRMAVVVEALLGLGTPFARAANGN